MKVYVSLSINTTKRVQELLLYCVCHACTQCSTGDAHTDNGVVDITAPLLQSKKEMGNGVWRGYWRETHSATTQCTDQDIYWERGGGIKGLPIAGRGMIAALELGPQSTCCLIECSTRGCTCPSSQWTFHPLPCKLLSCQEQSFSVPLCYYIDNHLYTFVIAFMIYNPLPSSLSINRWLMRGGSHMQDYTCIMLTIHSSVWSHLMIV